MPRIRGPIDVDGAILRVEVGVGAIDAADLRARNLPVPPPFATTALIDTGASRTVLHPMIVRHLGLIARDFDRVATAGATGPMTVTVPLHDASLALDGHSLHAFPVVAAEAVPATPTVLVLVGRDVLEGCSLLFDGQDKSFRLWF